MKRIGITAWTLLFLAALAGIAYPQKVSPETSESDLPVAAQNLIQETLAQDVNTAGYYELVAWCRELGLNDAGTREVLQQRLYGYYRISPPSAERKEKPKRILEIKSARETEYFTVEEIDEDYVLLQGDVLVELQEKEATHRIRAHRVLLNQTENILTAEGGLEYTLIKGKEEEVFIGERLTFDVESWEGVFFGGGMEAERSIAGQTVRFRFYGETISRLKDNNVVLDRGVITSCELPENPHYQIRARKIWVLAPNEWAILHAVLYVGHVPVLYLPFFFHPGDEFFFHPAIGYRNREGNFVQTTTYLIGQKKRSTSALSFLAATEESTVEYPREIRGLFLRQVGEEPVKIEEKRFLKLMVDIYSRLGGFVGIEGDFPPEVGFRSGLAVSRTLYPAYGSLYTPWKEEGGVYRSSWNESYLFGLLIPLRFGLDSRFSLGSGGYRLTGKFEYYSDPFFAGDFYNRAEDTGLTRLIGIEPAAEAAATEGERNNLTWELSSQVDFSSSLKTPYVKKLSFPYINASIYFQSDKNELLLWPDSSYDPARKFYYPVSMKLPSAALQVSGDLLDLTRPSARAARAAPADKKPSPAPATCLRLPEDLEGPSADAAASRARPADAGSEAAAGFGGIGFRAPEAKASVPVSLSKTPLRFRLSYKVSPSLVVEPTFNADTATMSEPADVTYELEHTSIGTSGSTSLDYSLNILENLLGLSGSIIYTGSYKTSFQQYYSGTAPEWEAELRDDRSKTQMNLASNANLKYRPLADDPVFGNTSLSYALNWTFYRFIWDGVSVYDPVYYGVGPQWDQSSVSRHNAQAALRWLMFDRESSFSLAADLPPRPVSLTGNLDFTVWLLTTTVNSVFRQEAGGTWQPEPLVVRETLAVSDNIKLSEELRFDLEQACLARSITSLSLWGFSGSLTAERMKPQLFSTQPPIWEDVPLSEYTFLPSYISLSYGLSRQDLYTWKNRIRLEASLKTAWTMNIQKFTENSLDFTFNFRFFIYKFLELSFTSTSYNNNTYRYFKNLAAELQPFGGQPYVNPLYDLLRSFNFFYPEDRELSSFKLRSISVEAIHHLHDWDLSLRYEGKPVINSDEKLYQWQSTFSILLQWIPIPELKRNLQGQWGIPDQEDGFSLWG